MSSWGPLSAEEIQEVINAPAMKAADIIRRHDPAWGYRGKKAYTVTIAKEVTVIEEAQIRIVADNPEDARKIAEGDKKSWRDLDFEETYDGDENMHVAEVKEIKK